MDPGENGNLQKLSECEDCLCAEWMCGGELDSMQPILLKC